MIKRYIDKLGPLASFGIAYTISSSVQKGVGFIAFMYLASLLSVAEYAKFGISYSLFTAISALSYSGIYESVVSLLRDSDNSRGRILFKAANTVFLVLTAFAFCIVWIVIYLFYSENFATTDVIVIMLAAGLSSLFVFLSIIIRLKEEHKISIMLSFVPAFMGYIGGYIAVRYFKTGASYFLGSLVALVLSLLILPYKKNELLDFSAEWKIISLVFSRITPYIIIALLAWISGYGNTFLVEYLFSDFEVGLFIFLFTISSIIQLVASSMNQVWSPRFFANYESESVEILEKKYNKFSILQGLVLGVVGGGIIIVAPHIFTYFTKLEKFANTSYEMYFLFAGYVISIPWWHSQNYFMINNKGKLLMNMTILSGISGYALWISIMIFLGPLGIFVGFFVQMALKTIVVFYAATKQWNINFDWIGVFMGLALLSVALLFTNLN